MTLEQYIRESGMTQKAFADRLDVHEVTVSRWLRGDRFPSRRSQKQIEALTAGAVAPLDWLQLEATP